MFNVSMFNVDLRPRVGEFLSARGRFFSRVRAPPLIFILTLQRYEYLIAVFECSPHFFIKIITPLVTIVIVTNVKKTFQPSQPPKF